jgi:hypothetical protein
MASARLFLVRYLLLTLSSGVLCFMMLEPHVAAQDEDTAWTESIVLSNNPRAWNPHLTTDPWGVVHAVWNGASNPDPQIDALTASDMIYYSRWDGVRWTEPVNVLATPGGRRANRPVIAAGSDGMLYVAWLSSGDIYLSSAPVDSASSVWAWAAPRVIFAGANLPYWVDLKADERGVLHLAFVKELADVFVISYSQSDNGGRSWSRSVEVSATKASVAARNPRLAVDQDGTLHATWAEVQLPDGAPPLGVFYARSTDNGLTWSEPLQMAGLGYGRTNVGLSDENTVHLVWSGTVGYEGRYHVWSADGGQTWTEAERLPGLEESFGTGFSEMVVDSTGVLHLATGINQQRYLTWRDGIWSNPEKIADVVHGREIDREGGMPRIALSEGNRLLVLYHDHWSVFFSSRLIDAPFRPVSTSVPALPTSDASEVTDLVSTPTAAPTATVSPTLYPVAPWAGDVASSNIPQPLIAGLVPVVLLLGVAVLYQMSRRRG